MKITLYDHQKELATHAQRCFEQGKKRVMIVSPAGSGKSILIGFMTKKATDAGKHVLFMVHRKELLDQISETLREFEVDLEKVTIMSVLRVKNRLASLPKPELIVTDETQHSKAKTYEAVYGYYAEVPRIGFTATPVRLSGEGFSDVYEALIEGKSVSWLIRHHYLAPYTYYSLPVIDRKKLKKQKGEFTNRSITEALNDAQIYGEVVQTHQEKANGEQAILYAHNVAYSKEYARLFCESGIPAVHVDSHTPKKEREKLMQGFKKKTYKIICNVDLISEGFNVPDCSTVILLRPTQSLTVYIQQAVRGMRYVPGKHATIIDHVGNYLKHGLPDTERRWSLEDGLLSDEQAEANLQECSKCQAIFSQWIQKENEHYKVKICPNCREEIWEEKEQPIEKEVVAVTLEEITQEEKLMLELKQYGHQNHVRFKENVLTIVKIFIARNLVAEYEQRRKPYNYPIQFAIREFLKLNHLNHVHWSEIEEQLEEIEQLFGKSYHVTAKNLKRYLKKIQSEYR